MTAVHIRDEDDTESRFLADVPFDQIGTVIPTIKSWSIKGEQPEMSGQFADDGEHVYFEVIIHPEASA